MSENWSSAISSHLTGPVRCLWCGKPLNRPNTLSKLGILCYLFRLFKVAVQGDMLLHFHRATLMAEKKYNLSVMLCSHRGWIKLFTQVNYMLSQCKDVIRSVFLSVEANSTCQWHELREFRITHLFTRVQKSEPKWLIYTAIANQPWDPPVTYDIKDIPLQAHSLEKWRRNFVLYSVSWREIRSPILSKRS